MSKPAAFMVEVGRTGRFEDSQAEDLSVPGAKGQGEPVTGESTTRLTEQPETNRYGI